MQNFYERAFSTIESFLSSQIEAITARDIQRATGFERDVVRQYLFKARKRGAVQMIAGSEVALYKLNSKSINGSDGNDQHVKAKSATR